MRAVMSRQIGWETPDAWQSKIQRRVFNDTWKAWRDKRKHDASAGVKRCLELYKFSSSCPLPSVPSFLENKSHSQNLLSNILFYVYLQTTAQFPFRNIQAPGELLCKLPVSWIVVGRVRTGSVLRKPFSAHKLLCLGHSVLYLRLCKNICQLRGCVWNSQKRCNSWTSRAVQ